MNNIKRKQLQDTPKTKISKEGNSSTQEKDQKCLRRHHLGTRKTKDTPKNAKVSKKGNSKTQKPKISKKAISRHQKHRFQKKTTS